MENTKVINWENAKAKAMAISGENAEDFVEQMHAETCLCTKNHQ